MTANVLIAILIISVILIINLYFIFKRAGKSSRKKGRGRNYVPPIEEKRKEWREIEISRRLESEQKEAYDRVQLRNDTLTYYDMVRRKYEKKEAMERLGIKVDENQLDEIKSLDIEDIKYRDIRDDIYITEDTGDEGDSQV